MTKEAPTRGPRGGEANAPSTDKLLRFRQTVRAHYAAHGRDLPWRRTRDPYSILVSEFMLQQTQVPRVLCRYESFLARFPDLACLAASPRAEVLREWQGLGYNRRALNLQRTAQLVVAGCGGALPRSPDALRSLPGIGPSTAGAICAFAFGVAVPFLETNIRAAFLHFFFPREQDVPDSRVLALVELSVDKDDPRSWYYALMDYGAWLKAGIPNPCRRSRAHAVQAPFSGSRRQLRGRILRLLAAAPIGNTGARRLTLEELAHALPEWSAEQVHAAVESLADEGFLHAAAGDGTSYALG